MLEIEDRPSDSPYVARVWRARSSGVERMRSVATSHWELVVWTHRGRVDVGVRGPETVASLADVPDDSEFFGISFAHGTTMPHLPIPRLVDGQTDSRHATPRSFVLRGEEWALPDFDSAEQFVARLVRAGVLVRDPLVAEAVPGDVAGVGARSVQRRVVATTGLTRSTIRQIERARRAALLLRARATPLDVVNRLGYHDQPHLSRSLTRFLGRTATHLRRDTAEPLSLLYKTDLSSGH
ncbi:helix-turn-helix domain-containing protein [Saccharomonospora halophila]|uniref:helix-turn-helix domain-containing protein n=1 Tax=Saccharomonospora halophila TaxID=129922 RepID=UPI00035D1F95|nr:helix-turn-helix domain-containing protein [Saccharomonospora halophila]